MKRYIVIGLIAVFILYVVPLLLVCVFQRRLMYFPPTVYLAPDAVNLVQAQEVSRTIATGDSVTGWWLPPESADGTVVMFFHGNGSAVYSNHDIYRDLHERGYGVYGVGYVGYPGSSGLPNQADIVAGAIEQYDWVLAQGNAPENIVFYGTSLGSGIAAQLALERRPAQLIMEASFNSTLDIGRQSMPVFPVGLFMQDTYRSDQALQHFDVPLIWMHGTDDEVIDLSQGQTLYEAYTGPKSKLIVEGGRHTNLWGLGGREFVFEALSH